MTRSGDAAHEQPRRPSTPRWVKVSGAIALVVVLLVGALLLFGGGSHGPSRHTGSDDAGVGAPADVVEGHTLPAGAH